MTSFLKSLRILPGPMFSLELVTSTRRARYFILRVLYAAILLVILYGIQDSTYNGREPDIGSVANFTARFFSMFGYAQLITVLLMGPAMVAGSIAMERERGTIEYLFTTTLSNSEIVLGKLTARIVQVFGLVLAGVPVLSLAMLMGGISPDALVVLMLMTLSTILTVAMISIAVSVWSTRARTAVIRAYLLLGLILIAPPLLAWVNQYQASRVLGWVSGQCMAADPIFAFSSMFEAFSMRQGNFIDPWPILGHLIGNQMIVAVASLVWATLAVRRVHLRQSGKAERRRRRRWQLIRGRIGSNPMFWKEMFARTASARLGLLGYTVLAVLFVGVGGITAYNFSEAIGQGSYAWSHDYYSEYAASMGSLLGCGGLLLLAARAAGCVTSEKERECWDSLLSSPLESREIVWAKTLGNLWSVRGLLVLLAIVWLPGAILSPLAIPEAIFSILVLMVIAFFVSSLGVFISLKAKNSLRAMGVTLGIGLFLGGGYLLCCIPLTFGSGGENAEIFLAPCMPFLLLFPTMAMAEHGMSPREQGALVAAFVFGLLGYLILGIALYSSAVIMFDELTGRTHPGGHMPRPARAASPPLLAPTMPPDKPS